MNSNIFPCLWFNDNGKEAADFYVSVFNGTYSADNPMVQHIELFGQKIMLLNGGPVFKKNASISLMIICYREEELLSYWNDLSQDGKVLMALDTYPFAKKYGWIIDKYGTTWQLYFGHIPENTQRIVPTLMFSNENNGKAQKAMDFYTAIFPNSKIEGVLKYKEGQESDIEAGENIQHAEFLLDNYKFACMDSSLSHNFNFNEGISIVKMTDSQSETDYLWNSLIADGGEESMCGWLKDQFGVSWQITPKQLIELISDASNPEKAQKAFQAMLKMKKIDIKEIKNAYNS